MDKKLTNRLSRIQGQIESLKNSIANQEQSSKDCLQNLQLLKASINALKKFGAAYMTQEAQKCLQTNDKKQLEKITTLAIETGFDI